MRTSLLPFVLASKKRETIVKTILEYPQRQWSCSSLEETTQLPHATVFRTVQGLQNFGLLKTTKINRRDLVYGLVSDAPIVKELQRMLHMEAILAKESALELINQIKSKKIIAAFLYGSAVKNQMKPDSDIDILIILQQHHLATEQEIQQKAANLGSKINKTLAVHIMDKKELKKEKNSVFIKSVKENKELLYGKDPLWKSEDMA